MKTLLALLLLLVGCDRASFGAIASESFVAETTLLIHPSAATTTPAGPPYNGNVWALGTNREPIRYPVPAQVGDSIIGWTVYLTRTAPGALTVAQLQTLPGGYVTHDAIGQAASNNAPTTGKIVLSMTLEAPHYVDHGDTYTIMVAGDGVAGDFVGGAMVKVQR